ncbi:hypothetical protein [Parasedimentitalea marina]|uniref:hypothetical protein n=1 Tax=Parasedimentitalea marina TaxID=2483033 RepID=UPI000FDBFE7D|nr:hypothetical protein [Parasedimentitalea marina]
MLTIYANAFRTATRMGPTNTVDAAAVDKPSKSRWLPSGHWWVQQDQGTSRSDHQYGYKARQ